jgi:hypothetical protein
MHLKIQYSFHFQVWTIKLLKLLYPSTEYPLNFISIHFEMCMKLKVTHLI